MEEEFNSKVVETTQSFVQKELEERFKKTGNSILVEKPFQKLTCHYISRIVPAYLRTEKALSSNPEAITEMKKAIDEFLYKIESKELGWQYVLYKDGQEFLKLFDEYGENIIDHKQIKINKIITKEQQLNNQLKRWFPKKNVEEKEE